jgi:hypothetical protein
MSDTLKKASSIRSCVTQSADPEKEKKNHKLDDPLILEDGSREENLRKAEPLQLEFSKSFDDPYVVNRFSRTAGRVHGGSRPKVAKKQASISRARRDPVDAISSSQEEGEDDSNEIEPDDNKNYDGIRALYLYYMNLSLSYFIVFLEWLGAFFSRAAENIARSRRRLSPKR